VALDECQTVSSAVTSALRPGFRKAAWADCKVESSDSECSLAAVFSGDCSSVLTASVEEIAKICEVDSVQEFSGVRSSVLTASVDHGNSERMKQMECDKTDCIASPNLPSHIATVDVSAELANQHKVQLPLHDTLLAPVFSTRNRYAKVPVANSFAPLANVGDMTEVDGKVDADEVLSSVAQDPTPASSCRAPSEGDSKTSCSYDEVALKGKAAKRKERLEKKCIDEQVPRSAGEDVDLAKVLTRRCEEVWKAESSK